jgi:hypothetical protein
MLGTIPEIEIDQVLIRDARLRGHRLEVDHHVLVQADGYGLLEVLDVGIFSPFIFEKS